jgi:hypothetical protein
MLVVLVVVVVVCTHTTTQLHCKTNIVVSTPGRTPEPWAVEGVVRCSRKGATTAQILTRSSYVLIL